MVGWHHRLNRHEFKQAPGVADGQGSLACCSSRGQRVGHDWATELTEAMRQHSWLKTRVNYSIFTFKGPPYCSLQWLYQFTFPPPVWEGLLFSTSFPAFITHGYFLWWPFWIKLELLYDPAIPLLGIYPGKIMTQKNTRMFIAALFIIAKIRKQPKSLSTDEWIKMWYIYTVECYPVI